MYSFAVATLQKVLVGFIARLPSLQAISFTPTAYVEYTLFTTHSMAHAAVIKLHYFAAGMAYESGYVDGASSSIIKTGIVARDQGRKAVRDALLAYDSMISQREDQQIQTPSRMLDPVPNDDNAIKVIVDAGRMMACLDKCLVSAREIVKVIQHVTPDQYSYVEPVICVSSLAVD